MVKHLVMFSLTNEAETVGRDQVIASLRSSITHMNGKIPGLLKAELWDNNIAGTHDIALYCEFQTPSDIAVFLQHPLHLAHKKMAADYVCNRVFIDFED